MIKCIKCNGVSGIKKSGILREKQRYYCKYCKLYFTINTSPPDNTKKKHFSTIKDIAIALGFSTSTVSKALQNHADVSAATKALILTKAKELDYVPNNLATWLRQQKTKTIGIVVPEFTQSYYPQIIIEINKILSKSTYTLIITQADNSYLNEIKNVNTLLKNQVDGIIASVTFETTDFAHFQRVIDLNIPLVLFSRYSTSLNCPKIKVNDFSGAYIAVTHLIKQGYNKIGYIGGPSHITLCQKRFSGYLQALKDNKLILRKNWVIHQNDVLSNADHYASKMINQKPRPDAIFAFSDPVAIGIIEIAQKNNIKIPEELGVVGFSNDPISKHITPGITTMAQPFKPRFCSRRK